MIRNKETVTEQLKSSPVPYAVGGLAIFTTGILVYLAAKRRKQWKEIMESDSSDPISAGVLR